MQERREHFRSPIALPVEVSLPGADGPEVRGTSSNISAGGVYFIAGTGCELKVGEQVGVRVTVPPEVGRASDFASLSADATVVRLDRVNSEGADNHTGIACQFTGLPELE